MSMQFTSDPSWEEPAIRTSLRRTCAALFVVVLIAGPIAVGGAVAWMLNSEMMSSPGDDSWVRMKPNISAASGSLPLISTAEIKAVGLQPEDVNAILRR